MSLVTDIKRIEKLAAEKEGANWRFRCFLKGADMESEELDAIVHKLYESVSAQIDCQECGHCCRVMHPILKKRDIERLATCLSMSVNQFQGKYVMKDEEEGGFTFRSTPCPFLTGNSCTLYPDRPADCRSYPHLHKKEFVTRLYGVLSNCSVCPIVYNVYELLKGELHKLEDESFFEDYELD